MTWNTQDRNVQSNIGVGTTTAFDLRGGDYFVQSKSTGTGTIDLQRLGADGATWVAAITQITATAGLQRISLPPGSYRWVVATFTANYLEVIRIPVAVD